MKRADLYFALVVAAFFVPFFLSRTLYEGYQSFNAAHGMVMSFVKFSILSTMGELLGLRISSGHYFRKGFGVLPRAVVWGFLGMGINMAFVVFSTGVPAFAAYLGVDNPAAIMEGAFSWGKVLLAFAISVTMNSIFAPVFMTFHKITDTHILMTGGTLRGLFSPYGRDYAEIELACTMGVRVQEDDTLVLVSCTYGNFPLAGRGARAFRGFVGSGFRCHFGSGSPQEIAGESDFNRFIIGVYIKRLNVVSINKKTVF